MPRVNSSSVSWTGPPPPRPAAHRAFTNLYSSKLNTSSIEEASKNSKNDLTKLNEALKKHVSSENDIVTVSTIRTGNIALPLVNESANCSNNRNENISCNSTNNGKVIYSSSDENVIAINHTNKNQRTDGFDKYSNNDKRSANSQRGHKENSNNRSNIHAYNNKNIVSNVDQKLNYVPNSSIERYETNNRDIVDNKSQIYHDSQFPTLHNSIPLDDLCNSPSISPSTTKQPSIIEEELPVPKEDLGRIIGRGGSTVNSIKAETGVSMRVNSSESVVLLKGTQEQIEYARRLIQNISGGGGLVILREVEERVYSYLNKNNYLANLRKEHNVSIEFSKKSIRIKSNEGNEEKAKQTKNSIQSLIEFVRKEMEVPEGKMSSIREKHKMRIFQRSYYLKVDFDIVDTCCKAIFSGLRCIVNDAMELTTAIINGQEECNSEAISVLTDMLSKCSEQKIEDLLADIHDCVEIHFDVNVQWKDGDSVIKVAGNDYLCDAKLELLQILRYYFGDMCQIISLPFNSIDAICGEEDQIFTKMLNDRLVGNIDRDGGYVWLCGEKNAVKAAETKIGEDLDEWLLYNHEIILHDRQAIGCVIGVKGETIRRLQEETKATITVEDDSIILIKASNQQAVIDGRKAVEYIIRRHEERTEDRRYEEKQSDRIARDNRELEDARSTRDYFKGNRDEVRHSRDEQRGNRDDFKASRDDFRDTRDDFRDSRDNFRDARDDFRGHKDDLTNIRDEIVVAKDFRGAKDEYRGGRSDEFYRAGRGMRTIGRSGTRRIRSYLDRDYSQMNRTTCGIGRANRQARSGTTDWWDRDRRRDRDPKYAVSLDTDKRDYSALRD